MSNISRIYISSDPLMTKEKEQYSNRRWLKDLLSRPVSRVTGMPILSLSSSLSAGDCIDRKIFFGRSGIEVDLDATQFWYDDSLINDDSIEYLKGFVGEGDLVIGYELSRQTRNILIRAGALYIDIWLHPVRFMDDVLFAFNSNVTSVRKAIFKYDLPEDLMYLYADRVKIQTYKGWRRVEADVEPYSALFVGQMMNDKSVCKNGTMLTLLDFKNKFESVCDRYNKVYYARHPYLKSGDEEIMDYIASIDNVQLTSTPSYRMLSSYRIPMVCGLSSSVLQEAIYFGKKVDYFYKPVLTYGNFLDPDSFATVFQEFVSPHFWADLLESIVDVKDRSVVKYIDQKDKIRDMLGFYWSYSDIDKTEFMRVNNKASVNVKAAVPAKKLAIKAHQASDLDFKHYDGLLPTGENLKRIEALVDSHKVISFDIFDTLVERVIDKPSDVFDLLDRRIVSENSSWEKGDYAGLRRKSRDLALDSANGEEVLLLDRCRAMAEKIGKPSSFASMLYDAECAAELKVCKAKYIGKYAYDYAKSKGKDIIIISDTYFSRSFVIDILKSCGYSGYKKLFLSSDLGVLKQTGRIYPKVKETLGKSGVDVVHFGDNKVADISKASEFGFDTCYIGDKNEMVASYSPVLAALDRLDSPHFRSLIKGLSARNLSGQVLSCDKSYTQGRADIFGYSVLGSLFYGFSQWILSESIKRGVDRVYFLARDGHIVKRCYDILAARNNNAPKSFYIYASRRSVNVANIKTVDDVLALLQVNFTPCSIGDLLENRFGIHPDAVPWDSLASYGYSSSSARADWRTSKKELESLFSSPVLFGLIKDNAEKERELILEYYSENKLLPGDSNIAFVDIGHSGSLQASLISMLNLSRTSGFYFATMENIDKKVCGSHYSKGYVVDRLKHEDKNHFYHKHILMFELVFQNSDGSFLCFEKSRKGNSLPVFLSMPAEKRRVDFIKIVHDSVCDFVSDISDFLNYFDLDQNLSPSDAISAYRCMLVGPGYQDVKMFSGIGFENKYSARDMKWIVPPSDKKSEPGLWLEGMAVLTNGGGDFLPDLVSTQHDEKQDFFTRFLVHLIKDERKKAKLIRDPHSFFSDSRDPVLRIFSKFYR